LEHALAIEGWLLNLHSVDCHAWGRRNSLSSGILPHVAHAHLRVVGVSVPRVESVELLLGPSESLRHHASPDCNEVVLARILSSQDKVLVVEHIVNVVTHLAIEGTRNALVYDVGEYLVGKPLGMMVR